MRKVLWTLVLLLPCLEMGCQDEYIKKGPVSRLEEAYKLALDGKYDDTKLYFTDEILKSLNTTPELTLPKIWAARLNDGAVKGFVLIEHQTDENNCDVKFMMILGDGPMTEGEETLVLEKGQWKLNNIRRVR